MAVKEYLPHTVRESVEHKALIMSELCHPYLPLVFGVYTADSPFLLVLQYYGIGLNSVTFQRELERRFIVKYEMWMILCSQIVEALHTKVGILHNDIKGDNVFICKPSLPSGIEYHVVIIDFGKASKLAEGKKYSLSLSEKVQYRKFHHHLAPELIDGLVQQNTTTDVFSLGKLFHMVLHHLCNTFSIAPHFTAVVERSTSKSPARRPAITDLKQRFHLML